MRCSAVEEWLPLAVSQDLPSDLLEEVTGHLDKCACCRASEVSLRDGLAVLQAAEESVDERIFAGFYEGVLARAGAPEPEPAPPAQRPRQRGGSRRWLGLLAAAAAVILLVGGPLRERGPAGPEQPFAVQPNPSLRPPDNLTRVGTGNPRRGLQGFQNDPEVVRRMFENFSDLPEVERMLRELFPAPPVEDKPDGDVETRSF